MKTTEPTQSAKIGKSILAVIAGFILVFAVSLGADALMHAVGIFPPWGEPMSDGLFALAATYRALIGIAGGFVTARLAPRRPMKHAVILGVLGSVAGLLGLIGTWDKGPEFGPKWYAILVMAMALPTCWLGARWKMYRDTANSN
ncbi:MAG: hypothetical protein KDK33_05965 [Leptospiraceae bacterium]|nr:hypothetical protein [Leptospiraceae bacterium]